MALRQLLALQQPVPAAMSWQTTLHAAGDVLEHHQLVLFPKNLSHPLARSQTTPSSVDLCFVSACIHKVSEDMAVKTNYDL